MKFLSILFVTLAMVCSCKKKEDTTSKSKVTTPPSTQKPISKILNLGEILMQDLQAKADINMGSAEVSQFNVNVQDEDVKMVQFTYFFQGSKSVQSSSIDKSKGYCEFSSNATADVNGAEVNLVAQDKVFISGHSSSEKTQINNLNYKYDAQFALTFQNSSKAAKNLRPQQFELRCYNVYNLADLKSTVDHKFLFTKKQEKPVE